MTVRVVVAEDHYLVRAGIRRALEETDDIEVVGSAANAEELEALVAAVHPDVVVTDIRMPPEFRTEGIEAALRIRSVAPHIGIVVLSQYADPAYTIELLRNGTSGIAYLLKERVGDPEELIGAVHTVDVGGSVIDPDVVGALVERNSQDPAGRLRELTARELDVLAGMAQGKTNAGIAEQLHLSESSVEKYSTSIFSKLGLGDTAQVHRRVSAVITYLHREGQARPL